MIVRSLNGEDNNNNNNNNSMCSDRIIHSYLRPGNNNNGKSDDDVSNDNDINNDDWIIHIPSMYSCHWQANSLASNLYALHCKSVNKQLHYTIEM